MEHTILVPEEIDLSHIRGGWLQEGEQAIPAEDSANAPGTSAEAIAPASFDACDKMLLFGNSGAAIFTVPSTVPL